MRKIFCEKAVLPLLLLSLLLSGCDTRKNLPFYQLEHREQTILTVDGVRYISDTGVACTGERPMCWAFTGEVGGVIGVCGGRDARRGGGCDVCEIAGDEQRLFLYVRPNQFVFGPYITYFLFREDLQLAPPSAETVSGFALTAGDQEAERTDPSLMSALFDFYFHDTGEPAPYTQADENITGFTLTACHRDYPVLTFCIKGSYHKESGDAYLTCSDHVRRRLPPDLALQLLTGKPAGLPIPV